MHNSYTINHSRIKRPLSQSCEGAFYLSVPQGPASHRRPCGAKGSQYNKCKVLKWRKAPEILISEQVSAQSVEIASLCSRCTLTDRTAVHASDSGGDDELFIIPNKQAQTFTPTTISFQPGKKPNSKLSGHVTELIAKK